MRKNIIKIVTGVVTFLTALVLISIIINQGNTDMTVEMKKATFPVVYMYNESGEEINCLRGYSTEMETASLRDTITPLTQDRGLSFCVDKYSNDISELSFEVRSIDGERLVESTKIREYTDGEDKLTANINIKDLIEADTEYSFILVLKTSSGQEIHYYTRIIMDTGYHDEEKVAFVKNFHEKSFDKKAAEELTTYLESNEEGDNSTLSKVTIHSSFAQITWGDLQVTRETEPEINILDLAEQTASIEIRYMVSVPDGQNTNYYKVREFYRVRYGTERVYLLDFERTMDAIFNPNNGVFTKNKIVLGITQDDIEMKECEGGNIFAFVQGNSLYSYNLADNKFARLFAFYDEENADTRTLYDAHAIKILSVDEAGNVRFMVYGYMNRGNHEGGVGVQIYYYDSGLNTIEEEVYVPYHKSYAMLEADISQLSYVNNSSGFYLIMGGSIYKVNLDDKTCQIVTEDLGVDGYRVSESNRMAVWQEGGDIYNCNSMIMMNFNTGDTVKIDAGDTKVVMPLGFMGEDLVYGVAYQTDVVTDGSGGVIFPMFSVVIQDEKGQVKKEYHEDGTYILGARIQDNQINLTRVTRNPETLAFIQLNDDQIVSSEVGDAGKNTIDTVTTKEFEKIVQIVVKKEMDTKSMKYLTPKEVLYEGGREISMERKEDVRYQYYVYGKNGIESISADPGSAISVADEISGVVVNEKGDYVWRKGNRSVKNQIMKITAAAVTEQSQTTAVCLDSILKYEGVTMDTAGLLAAGETVQSVLSKTMPEARILDLTGCSLDSVLYYVNRDLPVLAVLNDGNAVLIVGYNELNAVIMDPATGTIYKKGIKDSEAWFSENGNRFITYIR